MRRNCNIYHLVDIAIVNGFLLFQQYRGENPDKEALRRINTYSIADFREALVRQICHWPEYEDPPTCVARTPSESQFETVHMPEVSGEKRNCVVCYKEGRGPQCQKYLHITSNFNSFRTWHSRRYNR